MLAGFVVALALAAAPADDRQAQLAAIGRRGQLLYDYDQAAWHTTDALLAALPGAPGVRGYIVEPGPAGLRVTYYGSKGDTAVPIFVADYARGKVSNARIVPETERVGLGPMQMRMVQARTPQGADKLKRCSAAPYNMVVLPPVTADAPVEVYMLTPQAASRSYPFGGHHHLRVGTDGKIIADRQFAKSCLVMTPPPGAEGFMAVTHLLGPNPTEIHVFNSLASGTPVVVITGPDRFWFVQGASITPSPAKNRRKQ